MQSDYYINLHFNQAVAQRTGYAFKIGDKGCTFHLHCEDLDPSGMYPHIVFNHPNNTCVEGIPSGSGQDYEYTIAGNEFGVCGKTVVDLKFYDSNNEATQRISTASFLIEIIPDTLVPFDEDASSYADSLERAREEIDAAIIELQGAERDLDDMSGQFADTLQDYIDAFGNTAPINPRGEYDPNEQYVPRDAVEYTAGGKTLTYINRSACTGIAPTDPDHGAEHWQIMIDVSVGGSFSALSDVSVDPQTLADGQVPVYNATDQVWENKTILEDSLTSTATNKALTAAKGKELQDNKQPKELDTAITVAGTLKTTVEDALGAINTMASTKAERADLATLNLTGSTNSTGSTITAGTYFYLNGLYCKAKTSIVNGATFTLNTNYEAASVGEEISSINDDLANKVNITKPADITIDPASKTIAQTLFSILQQIDFNKVTPYSLLVIADSVICRVTYKTSSQVVFSSVVYESIHLNTFMLRIKENNNSATQYTNGVESDIGSSIVTSTYKLYY